MFPDPDFHFFVTKPRHNLCHRAIGMNIFRLNRKISSGTPASSASRTSRSRDPLGRRHGTIAGVVLGVALGMSNPGATSAQPPTAAPSRAEPQGAPKIAPQDDAETARKLAIADRGGDGDALMMLATAWIARDAAAADAYYWRGRERFRRGEVAQSVQDFDRYVELRPDREPPQWERGIALYYNGQFARGAKQFELYQTYDNRDVENSVWRYLCLARAENRDKARATMLPVDRDPRVPMTEIFQLFAGKATPEQVLAAARANDPPAEVLAGRLFYAHLYLALFHESEGQTERCRQYLALAADKELRRNPRINPYMWAVADVHWKRLQAAPR